MQENGTTLTLLYVEDDPITREDVAESLREAGFKVLTAADGTAAMQLLDDSKVELCGLITDIDLGDNCDGWQLARRARALVDGLPVVYVSGASANDWTAQGVPHSVMVPKPFATQQIVVAISNLLNRSDV